MCHGHHRSATEFESASEPGRRDVRASDAERDAAVERLRTHTQAGRLTAEELDQRVEQALHATTRADLDALEGDLPAAPARVRPRPQGRDRGPSKLIPIAVLLVAIWAATGAGYFWPMWPLLWFAFVGFRYMGHSRVTR
jgi:hypothetical protein